MTQALWDLVCRLITVGSKITVTGQEQIPPSPVIFAVNHPTSFDPCYVYRYTERASIVMTEFVFELPIAGRLVSGCGFIPVPMRERPRLKNNGAFPLALNALLSSRNILIAPEGKLTDGAKKAHTGAAKLAWKSGCPIVPIGLRHEGKVYSRLMGGQRIKFMPKGKTFVNIGTPFYVEGSDLEEQTSQLMDDIYFLAAQ
jgi:1-acyl-sn-glycerol-3-phosphate acyltransferase